MLIPSMHERENKNITIILFNNLNKLFSNLDFVNKIIKIDLDKN